MKSARIIVAVLLFIAVLELCARVDDYFTYGASIVGVYSEANLYENDHLGKRGKPFARYHKWRLNKFGYRGPEIEENRATIVTFGASETFGLYESEDKEYPRQLEQELNARAERPIFQVVNVAYPGQTIPTATQRIPEIVGRLHPLVALIYAPLAFYIDDVPPKRSATQVPSADVKPAFKWRITDRLQDVAKTVLPDQVQTWMRQWLIRRWTAKTPTIDRLPEEKVNRFRNDLSRLLTTLRANGVEPVVLTHATIFGTVPSNPDRGLLIAWRKFYPSLTEEGFLDMEQRLNRAMREVASRQHVMVIDIAREIPPDRTYFADFVHFTDAGSALMAKRLADGLEPLMQQSLGSLFAKSSSNSPKPQPEDILSR